MKDKRLRLSSLHNPAPLLPVEFATHDLLVKGGFVRFNISPCLTCAKLKVFFGFSLRSQKETKATNTQKQKKTFVFFLLFTIL